MFWVAAKKRVMPLSSMGRQNKLPQRRNSKLPALYCGSIRFPSVSKISTVGANSFI